MRYMIALSLTAILLSALSGCERYALDRQMEELCKKDGGVKVYETVTLPASEFNNLGEPLGRYWKPGTPEEERFGPDYKFVQKREILVGTNAKAERGEGQLTRWYEAILRRSDGRILGESILYDRSGGDGFTFGFQPSGNSCPKPRVGLFTSVFVKGK